MTSISATQYSSYYGLAAILNGTTPAPAQNPADTTTSASSGTSATTITLSAAARAALDGKDFATVITETRAALSKLLADAKATSPYKDGAPTVDLKSFDSRAVYAIASNGNGQFTADEQALASQTLQTRFDQALSGPAAVARVTGKLSDLYKAAGTYLDSLSPEQKSTDAWKAQKAAVVEATKDLAADPNTMPEIDGDPVADYLDRVSAGTAGQLRDFSDVASDARAALDAQYADARANGKQLVFNAYQKTGQRADFSDFDSRSLSAVVLNQDGKFSTEEASAAKAEIRSRSSATLIAGLKSAGSSGDPAAFAQNIISAYGSMSPEERQAAGWSEDFYQTAVQNYQTATKLASMFSTGSGATALLGSSGASASSPALSLLDYL